MFVDPAYMALDWSANCQTEAVATVSVSSNRRPGCGENGAVREPGYSPRGGARASKRLLASRDGGGTPVALRI